MGIPTVEVGFRSTNGPVVGQGIAPCPNCGNPHMLVQLANAQMCFRCGHMNYYHQDPEVPRAEIHQMEPGQQIEPAAECPDCGAHDFRLIGHPTVGRMCITCGYDIVSVWADTDEEAA